MAVEPIKRRFTTAEFHTMLEAGILSEDDRTELIEGEILQMAPIGSRHAACVNRLNGLFSRLLGERAIVAVQNPVRLSDFSEPEPDLALLRPREDFYEPGHPEPADVLLLIEVAETSVDFDRRVKARLYAESGIPELWLVDLARGVVEAHRAPSGGRYGEAAIFRSGERLSPQAFPDCEVEVRAVLGS